MRTTQIFDDVLEAGETGQIIQHDGTKWARTAPGAGTGDVVGPASAGDNKVPTFDGTTGKLIQSPGFGPEIEPTDGDLFIDPDDHGSGLHFGAIGGQWSSILGNSGDNSLGFYTALTPGSISLVLNLEGDVASSVNYVSLTNSATGTGPTIASAGSDTNVDLLLVAKGNGVVKADGVEVVTLTGTQTLTNKTLTAPAISDFTNAGHDHLDADDGGVLTMPAVGVSNSSTVGQVLRVTGASTYAFGALDLADTDAVTGLLPQANIAKSGTVIARIIKIKPPATSGAVEVSIAGGSTPAEDLNAWAFDQTGPEYLDFYCRLSPQYSGGGLTIYHLWSGNATTNNVRWGGAIRRFADGAETLSASHTYDYNDASDSAAPGTTTISKSTTIAFTNGSDMDSLAAGEPFIYRVRRTAATSNMAADAYLWDVEIRET
jgi:hypothetical protein